MNRKSVLRSAVTLLVVILLTASCGKKEEPKVAVPPPPDFAPTPSATDPMLPVTPPPASPGSFTCGDATCDAKKEYCRTESKGKLRVGEVGWVTASCLALPAACTTAKNPTCACFGKVPSCTCLPEDGPRFLLVCSTG